MMWILFLGTLIVSALAAARVQANYARFSRVAAGSGLSGDTEGMSMSSEAFLVRSLCIGGQFSSRGTVDQEHIEHFSGRICHYTKWPSIEAGPLLLNIDAIGVECSRVLQPAGIK